MYSSIYVFRIARARLDEFTTLQREAAAVYADHGAIESRTYEASDTIAKYDCESFDELTHGTDDVVLVGVDVFADQPAYEAGMESIAGDDRLAPLGDQFEALVRAGDLHAYRGEFKQVT